MQRTLLKGIPKDVAAMYMHPAAMTPGFVWQHKFVLILQERKSIDIHRACGRSTLTNIPVVQVSPGSLGNLINVMARVFL